MFFDFDPTELAPDLVAIKQREQLRAQLARLEGKEGSTDDNKAEIKELKKLLSEQQKELAEQKGNQNLLFELSIQLADLDERIGQDDQFEAAAKEFIDLHGKLDSALLSHKKYDTLEFKELAIKTGKSFERLVTNPKLKLLIAELAEAEEKKRAIEKQKRAQRAEAERKARADKQKAREKDGHFQEALLEINRVRSSSGYAPQTFDALPKEDQKVVLKVAEAKLEEARERIKEDQELNERIKEDQELNEKRRKWARLDQIEVEED